jgi:uncharacterized protein (DUF1330 family)
MAVYLIIEYDKINDETQYAEYIKKAGPIIKKYGGEYLVRTNKIIQLSGNWNPERIVIIKFPLKENIDRCFSSDEYRSISSLRAASTNGKAIIVEGYTG